MQNPPAVAVPPPPVPLPTTALPPMEGIATATSPEILSKQLSLWDLFLSADIVVQFVILLLVLASFWSWTIICAKIIRLRTLNKAAHKFEEIFWSGISLETLYDRTGERPSDPFSAVFVAAMREWKRSTVNSRTAFALQSRIERAMEVVINREIENLESHTGFLALVGSTATFVGLFGTVWGIMHSFQSIAASHNTSLEVVAPGIAEALFATAIGLIAAIPAMMAFKHLATAINSYANRLDSFSSEFAAVVSRQLEEGR